MELDMGKINLNFLKTKEKTNPDTRTYEELLGLVLEYMPEDEYKKWEGKRGKVGAYSHEWPEFNNTTTPKEWLSIYRYSQTYAASTIKTKSLLSNPSSNIRIGFPCLARVENIARIPV